MSDNKVNGEFTFTLIEKTDRNGQTYLRGGIHLINAVLFVRPLGVTGPDGCPRWQATLKPYTGPQSKTIDNPDDTGWEDETPDQNTRRRQR